MAELKNNFTGAKINKDVDKKILPKNEYREAQNISIPESNDEGVGSAEPILGNELNYTTALSYASGTEVIGYYLDEVNNNVYWFVTDQTQYTRATSQQNTTAEISDPPAT
mgnify:CR=1 FL=1|jgi:hypothetical protein